MVCVAPPAQTPLAVGDRDGVEGGIVQGKATRLGQGQTQDVAEQAVQNAAVSDD